MTKTAKGKKIKVTQPRTKPASAKATKEVEKASAAESAASAGRAAEKQDSGDRQPAVGTTLRKLDRAGKVRCECVIEKGGVRYQGTLYKSLSGAALAAAKELGLSGNSFNGYVFWGLSKPSRASADPAMRLEQIWKRYSELAVEALKGDGDKKGEALKVLKGHGSQLSAIIG
jgi:hypothetical protein